MATYVPAKRGVAYRTWVSLVSQSSRPQFQTNPTLAAGDVKVSKDGGALTNLTTLPVVTPAASKIVQVDLSATEMTADIVVIVFADAAGAEWDDAVLVIPTVARQLDDLAFPTTSGRSMDVTATGEVGLDFDNTVGTLAKGTDLTGFNDLDAAGVRGAVGLAAANLDTQLAGKAVPGDAMALTVAERAATADKLLGRSRAGGADGGRTVASCLAFGRNKWAIAAGVLTVYDDDDVTPLFTAAVATAAGDPVTSIDPV